MRFAKPNQLTLLASIFLVLASIACKSKFTVQDPATETARTAAGGGNASGDDDDDDDGDNDDDGDSSDPTNLTAAWTTTVGSLNVDALTGISTTVAATDADGSVTYSLDTAAMTCDDGAWSPALSINATTGALSGTPSKSDVGSCTIKILSTSPGDTLSQTFTVTVKAIEGESTMTTAEDANSIDMAWTGTQFGAVYYKGPAGSREIYFSRISAGGGAIGSPTQVSTSTTSTASTPRIVWTGNEFGVTYRDTDLTDTNLYFVRVSAAGAVQGSPILLTLDDTASVSANYDLVWTGTEFACAYSDNRLGDFNVYFARISSAGVKQSETLLTVDDTAGADNPVVVWNGYDYGVAYTDSRLTDTNAYFVRVSAAGAVVGSEVLLTADDNFYVVDIDMVWADGRYGIVYNEDLLGDYNSYFQLVSDTGVKVSSATLLTVNDTADSNSTRIVWNGREFGVVYSDNRLTDTNVYFARISTSGQKLGSEVLITPDDTSSTWGSLFGLTWTGSEYGILYDDAVTSDVNTYLARVNADGTEIGTETLLSTDDTVDDTSLKRALAWTGSAYAMAYADDRSGVDNIYFNIQFGGGPAMPSTLGWDVAPANVYTNECTLMTLAWYDDAGLRAPAFYTTTASVSGYSNAAFYLDKTCTTSTTSVPIVKDSLKTDIYYKPTVAAANTTVTAAAPTGLSTAGAVQFDTSTWTGQTATQILYQNASNGMYVVNYAYNGSGYGVLYSRDMIAYTDLFFLIIDEDGTILSGPTRFADSPDTEQYDAEIIWNGSEYAVAWIDDSTGDDNVFFARINASGAKIGSDVRISPDDTGTARGLSMVWNGTNYGVSYSDNRLTDYNVYFSLLNSNGVSQGEALISVDDTANIWDSQLIWAGTQFAMVYGDSRLTDTNVYIALISAAGAKIGSEILVTVDDTSNGGGSNLVWNGSEFALTYYDALLGDRNLYFSRFSSTGTKIGTDTLLTIDDAFDAIYGGIVWTGKEYGIAYRDAVLTDANCYFARVSAGGVMLGSPVLLTVDDTVDAYECTWVMWTGSEFGVAYIEGSGLPYDFYFARMSSGGEILENQIFEAGWGYYVKLLWDNDRYSMLTLGDYTVSAGFKVRFYTYEGGGLSQPTNIKVSEGQSDLNASECLRYRMSLRDDRGTLAQISNLSILTVSETGSGGFYSNSGCSTSASTASIWPTLSTADIYYKNAVSEDAVINSDFSGWTTGTLNVSILP